MKLGTVTYNLAKDWDIPTIIEKLSANRFEGVELRTTHAHGVELSLSPAERADVRRRFADSPVTLVGLGSTYEYHSADPEELRANIEGTKEYARLAADVGAQGIKVRPNGVQDDKGIPRERTYEQIGRSFDECAAFAADYGVEVRMEVHGRVTQEPDNFMQIMQYVEHPNARICWNSNPPDVTASGSIKPNFDRMADRIGLVHMRDIYIPDYPWRELVSLLQSINYQGFCLAEIPESPEPERIMGYYRALWDAYNDLARR
ncbi:MAG: sugar phosphate isomerase/epimerase [Anaerolineae bacterium]|nr:sugar phosphate isomerase/epimerase [Anaerolineae bacterium]